MRILKLDVTLVVEMVVTSTETKKQQQQKLDFHNDEKNEYTLMINHDGHFDLKSKCHIYHKDMSH